MAEMDSYIKAGRLILICPACKSKTTLAETFDRNVRGPICPGCDWKLSVGVSSAEPPFPLKRKQEAK